MIAKKNPGLNLEGKRTVLFSLGLLTMGAATLAAFTYHSEYQSELEKRKVASVPIDYMVEEREPEIVEKQMEQKTNQAQDDKTVVAFNDPDPTSINLNDLKVTQNDPNKVVKVGINVGAPDINIGKINNTKGAVKEPIDFPEVDAQFVGGYPEMQAFIAKNVKYPELDLDMGIQGTVYINFVVELDGSISNVIIERGVSEGLDREAKRIVKGFPNWIPGQSQAENVRTRVRLPIRFTAK